MSSTRSLDAASKTRSNPLGIGRTSLRPHLVRTERDQISSLHSKLSDIHEKVATLAELIDSFRPDRARPERVNPQPTRRLELVKRGEVEPIGI